MADLLKLADDMERINAKLRRLMTGEADLSAQGTATAVALLIGLNLLTLEAVPAALRALSNKGKDHVG